MKIRIYTDGACSENPGPGGWAAVFCSERKCKSIAGGSKSTTNNRMELKAAMMSLKAILDMRNNYKHSFELFSDSAYVVNAINSNWIDKWKQNGWKVAKGEDLKNKDMWIEFYGMLQKIRKEKIDLKVIKIKGHAGHTFNELVDSLAKEQAMLAKGGKANERVSKVRNDML